jgi:hypothetical protein
VANIEVLRLLPKLLDNSMNWEVKYQLTQLIVTLVANRNIQKQEIAIQVSTLG